MSLKNKFILSLVGLFPSVAWAQNPPPVLPPVVADGTTQTSVSTGANGRVTVNIAPVAVGVTGDISHNSFSNFNVPISGVSLDNRGVDARTIVNSVSSSNPSLLEGSLDVIGNQAHVVISNPNGIKVNGGNFINTGGVIVTTGDISYVDRQVTPVTIQRNVVITTNRGEVTVDGSGLSSLLTNLEIIAQKITINAAVENTHSNENAHVRLIAGNSNIEVNSSISVIDQENDWLNLTSGANADSHNAILVDITNLGSLTSGRVAIAVTDQGAGVRTAGSITSTQKDFTIDTNGAIHFVGGNVTSNTHSFMRTTGDILFSGTNLQAGTLSADETEITSLGGVSLDAANITFSNQVDGKEFTPSFLSSTTSMFITTTGLTRNDGSIINALGNIHVDAGSFMNEGVRHRNEWQSAQMNAVGGGLLIKTQDSLVNVGGLLQGNVRILDNADSLGGVTLISNDIIENKTVATDAVATIFSTTDDVVLTAKGSITNNVGQVLSNAALHITSQEGEWRNIAEKEEIADSGIEYTTNTKGGKVLFRSSHKKEWNLAYGEARVEGLAAVASAKGDIHIQAVNVTNYGGNILSSNGKISIESGDVTNEAMLSGHAWTRRDCRFFCSTKAYSNIAQTGGLMVSQGDIDIQATGQISNIGGDIETLSGNITLNSPQDIVTQGLLFHEVHSLDRGLTSVFTGDYVQLLRYDQGGNIRANMGYISVPSGTKIIADGGVVLSQTQQIVGGIEVVRLPLDRPSALTDDEVGFFSFGLQ
jgi:filamentous hemagglutinin family protein